MELRQKPDFEEVMQRYEAWWQCELIDRPLLSIGVESHHEHVLPKKQYATLREKWMDFEHKLDCLEAGIEGELFPAETLPSFYPGLGPEVCSTIFGAELQFGERTTWSVPVAQNCGEILLIKPNLDNAYWNAIRDATELSLQRGKGKWLTGITDLHTNGDLVASLRDPQNLCIELVDDPQAVKDACNYVTDFYPQIYDDLWNRIKAAGQPNTTWMQILDRGRSYVTSCDFMCMISPKMFEEFILPSIVREMRFLDHSIFHIDGPGSLRQLDVLLRLPEVNCVQWGYGAGNGPARKWMDVYKKTQAAGKGLQILCEDMTDANAMIENLRPEGVWMCVDGTYTLDEVNSFIRRLENWAAGKR